MVIEGSSTSSCQRSWAEALMSLRPFMLANDAEEDRTSKGTVLRHLSVTSPGALRPILVANHFRCPSWFFGTRKILSFQTARPKLWPILLPIDVKWPGVATIYSQWLFVKFWGPFWSQSKLRPITLGVSVRPMKFVLSLLRPIFVANHFCGPFPSKWPRSIAAILWKWRPANHRSRMCGHFLRFSCLFWEDSNDRVVELSIQDPLV